jgi:tetratricopeptide (TPR) repeat protein/tRNA A-37 threonylcarbamoyl transferase component Bud32/TolB-like protein
MDAFRAQIEQALSGSYTFERELGGGGMSRTYLARERALSRQVVVKVLAPELLQGLSVERFNREVLLAAQLQHPHVVPVLSAGDANGVPWFTMPYVDGDSLRERMAQGPVPLSEALSILRDVARALAYAHQHGVVHRDIKPDNVLLSGGSATVTDFGIAKAISASRTAAGNATLTQAGMSIGTPAYMAPEQAAGDPALDHRADLYAFGAMAYELLGGQQVFAHGTPAQVIAAHMRDTPRDLRELRPGLPESLTALVMQCLAKDPTDRPSDAGAIARALDAVGASGVTTAATAAATRVSLGRALGLWAGFSSVVLLATWGATQVIGLPDWVLGGAVGLMLAGLPAVTATWWVQRAARRAAVATPTLTPGGTRLPQSTMATMALKASPHVSWRRTWRAGAAAVGTLALLVVAFLVTRAMGIGPAASLMGQGAFGDRETIVVADFNPPAGDTLLGVTVGEALRTDLGQSSNLRVLSRQSVREILQRMLKPAETAVRFDVAREVATREGAKAVVDGDVTRLGSGYVLSARLVSALDGAELATFRETAADDDALIAAVGTLSRAIRTKIGESLKGIRQSNPVDRVTTPSLAALRKYMEGVKAEEIDGEVERAAQLYEEAIAIDTGFAMAWRKLAVVVRNNRLGREKELAAISAAWRFRDRLSEEERAITEGSYYNYGPEPDARKSLAAYEQLLARDSNNRTALNNAAGVYRNLREFEKAERMYRAALSQEGTFSPGFTNLAQTLIDVGGSAERVDSVARSMEERLPTNANTWEARVWAQWAAGQYPAAAALAEQVRRSARTGRQTELSAAVSEVIAAFDGRRSAALDFAVQRSLAIQKNTGLPSAAMSTALDSAFSTMVLDGDAARSRTLLQHAVAPSAVQALTPSERLWRRALLTAALVGDATAASVAQQGYLTDLAPIDPFRAWSERNTTALVAFAKGDWDGAVAGFREAIGQRASPSIEEAFFVAMAHDRAGRADSAVVWYERAVARRTAEVGSVTYFWPTAHRRLGELYDARGDAAKALKNYDWFVDRWKNADAPQQATVRSVKARADVLRRQMSPG